MVSEDDQLHLSYESSDFEEDQTLPENASKQYGLFEPYTAENRSTDDSSDQEETPVDILLFSTLFFLLFHSYLGAF